MAGRDPVALSPGEDETPFKYCATCGLQDQARSFQHLAVGSWKTPTARGLATRRKKSPSKGAGDKPLVK